jgi:hypothetical protein
MVSERNCVDETCMYVVCVCGVCLQSSHSSKIPHKRPSPLSRRGMLRRALLFARREARRSGKPAGRHGRPTLSLFVDSLACLMALLASAHICNSACLVCYASSFCAGTHAAAVVCAVPCLRMVLTAHTPTRPTSPRAGAASLASSLPFCQSLKASLARWALWFPRRCDGVCMYVVFVVGTQQCYSNLSDVGLCLHSARPHYSFIADPSCQNPHEGRAMGDNQPPDCRLAAGRGCLRARLERASGLSSAGKSGDCLTDAFSPRNILAHSPVSSSLLNWMPPFSAWRFSMSA